MRAFNYNIILFISVCAALMFSSVGCKKDVEITRNYDYNVIYEVDTTWLYQSSADKTKQKTSDQYISILYSDLHQKSIPGNDLDEITQLSIAVGDKQVVNEFLLGNYMNSGNVIIPTDSEMRLDIEKFILDTYKRFYLRKPTELEKEYLVNLIEGDNSITPDIVFTAFSLSNEYLFY